MASPSLSDPRNYLTRADTSLGAQAQPGASFPDMPPPSPAGVQEWDPEGDLEPPASHFARLYVPTSERVPPMPPVPEPRPRAEAVQEQTHNTAAGQDLNAQLGFPCHSVIVDNLTNQWLFFRSARRWVAPYTYGAIVAFHQSTQIAGYVCAAPPGGFTLPAAIPGEQVQTTWLAAFNMPASGNAVTKA